MRGIEKIVAQIIQEAKTREAEIEQEALLKADAIKDIAKQEAEELESKIKDEAMKEALEMENIALLTGEQKRRQALLEAKQEIIGDIVDKAYKRLVNMADDRYFEIIEQMLYEYVLSEKGEIIFAEHDKKRMPKGFEDIIREAAEKKGGQLKMSKEIRNIDGGFVLVYGGIEENCTFKALAAAKREELHDIVNRELFG